MRRSISTLVFILCAARLAAQSPEIRLSHRVDGVREFSGRVFVVATKRDPGRQAFGQNWFNPEPFYAQDAIHWPAGESMVFRPTVGMPIAYDALPVGTYFLQAILDRDLGGMDPLTSSGNLFSLARKVEWDPKNPTTVELVADQTTPERSFTDKPRMKLFEIESKLLTAFHGKPMKMRAGVVLPKSHAEEPERRYPAIYEIPGFSGTHRFALAAEGRDATEVDGVEMLHVTLDPSCRLGHHVFADSENNGPVGRALIEEMIPAFEERFRAVGRASGRLVTGHSSGGWSSLWLQTAYPDFFGGVWSTAPDSVDFRDFQKVDIHQPGVNLFVDEANKPRPLARKDGKVVLEYRRFSDMENVLGRGGQLGSFEAVFSPRGSDGKPARLWNRDTGVIDPAVAKSWEKYDIRRILETNWPNLKDKLAGKIHVYMGGEDTFYLDGATRLLQESLQRLKADAVVEIFPDRHHGNLIDATLRRRIHREMAEASRRTGS